MKTLRLTQAHVAEAQALFRMMAGVFEEPREDVRPDRQRQGIGRQLMGHLRAAAAAEGIGDVFVPAENEDTHALDFYRALGGTPSAVTFFTFGGGRS